MKIENIQQLIYKSIEETKLSSGIELKDLLEVQDIMNLSNNITHRLPPNPDILCKTIYNETLSVFDLEQFELFVNNNIKELILKQIQGTLNREQHTLLIFYLILQFKNTHNIEFTEQLNNIRYYLSSYIIETVDALQDEIKLNPIAGVTRQHRDSYIRFDNFLNMIPTIETITNFKNFL